MLNPEDNKTNFVWCHYSVFSVDVNELQLQTCESSIIVFPVHAVLMHVLILKAVHPDFKTQVVKK